MAQINVPKLTAANGHLNSADLAICAREVFLIKLTSKITHQVRVSLKAFIDKMKQNTLYETSFWSNAIFGVLHLNYTTQENLNYSIVNDDATLCACV